MVDERILDYLLDDMRGEQEIVKLKLLKRRGFLIDPHADGIISFNYFQKNLDNRDLVELSKLSVDDIVESLFCRDSIIAHEVYARFQDKWGKLFASNRIYGAKVPTIQLEPFMAKLVHSLALCGMHTFYSCDGWHVEREKKDRATIGFLDRNSLIWFCTLLQYDPDLVDIRTEYKIEEHFITWYFSETNRFSVYKALDRIADILYQKRVQFRSQKRMVINSLKGQKKSSLSDDELKKLLEMAYRECQVDVEEYIECNWGCVTNEQAGAFIRETVE